MRIAIVTTGFSVSQPGGVSRVALSVIRLIGQMKHNSLDVISFSNSRSDKNSIRIFDPRTYFNKRISEECDRGIYFISIGTFGSEFEFLRYRKRRELKYVFQKYDLVFVVTGVLNFANVIPKTKATVIVQCATRLNWERKSQYKKMRYIRKTILKFQAPLLRLQELCVLKSDYHFLSENKKFDSWLQGQTIHEPFLWYPGTPEKEIDFDTKKHLFFEGPIVSIGRLNEPRKGWSRLFLSYELARKLDPTLPKLHVIGWGEFGGDDQQLLSEINIDNSIVIHRNLTDLERDSFLKESSIYIQASYEEGLGLAMIEAMCFGLPVVSSETHGSAECIRNGENGILVKEGPNFEDRFAQALIELRNSNLGKKGVGSRRIFLEHFSDSSSQSKLINILNQIMKIN